MTVTVAEALPKTVDSPIRRSLRSLRRNPMAMLGLVIIVFWAVAAIIAPFTPMRDPLSQTINDRLQSPSAQYWFGTDELGRDVFSRVIYGARISLPIGFVVILFAVMMGVLVGASAGYIGGTYDLLIMRLADITLAFPSIVLALAIAAVLGPSITNALIAMVLVWWPEYARLMRSQVLSVKNNEYVTAAVALGASRGRILMTHILPNTFAPVLVKASLDAGSAILNIAALSFIGLGAVPPTPEWGAMISTGRYQFYSWWLTTFPGLAILMVVLGYNFLGEGVRDSFDPRMT
ncbi:MAG: ABC transporter permease [Chloroflexi bacterium]|jgi:peptide/nickel transport system permease protein|nr:ABC transporter permease [Chloroflexota bacterium]